MDGLVRSPWSTVYSVCPGCGPCARPRWRRPQGPSSPGSDTRGRRGSEGVGEDITKLGGNARAQGGMLQKPNARQKEPPA